MISDKFLIFGVALQMLGGLAYARDTLRGKAKPNRVTWFLWFFAPVVAFTAELNKGVGLVAIMTLSIGLEPLIVLLASFANKKSYWKLNWTDYICGALSLLGIGLWLIFREANIAIIFNIGADLLAAAPTLVKSYKYPETESVVGYWPAIVNSAIALLVINKWTVANYGFPIYIFLVNIVFVFLIKYRVGLRIQGKPA